MKKSVPGIPRKRKKMALYEVLSKGLSKSRNRQQLEAFSSQEPTPYPGQEKFSHYTQPIPSKPSIAQLNRGRLFLSLRYELVVVIILMLALGFMMSYRFGQHMALAESKTDPDAAAAPAIEQQQSPPLQVSNAPVRPQEQSVPVISVERLSSIEPSGTGNNWIVIQSHKNKRDLVPVQAYFAGNGVGTQIRQSGGRFLLHTIATYDNPTCFGTDGYKARLRIIEIGAGYKPPPGYGKFNFNTAYGMKSVE